jgi:trehalose-phosphatase
MDYLFDKWNDIVSRFEHKQIFLFLDYDGTISPIVEHPDEAVIPENIRATLNQLVQDGKTGVAVISGRSLSDVKQRVNIDGIIYSGNHGLEIEGPGIRYEYDIPGLYRRELEHIKTALTAAISGMKGVVLEDKGLTLSVHYRLAEDSIVPELHHILAQYYSNKIVQVREDKKTFEIVPLLAWNKGNAVLSILSNCKPESGRPLLPIYLGDTFTDENAFIAINDTGITVRVGFFKHSSAQYYLNDVHDVYEFLNRFTAGQQAG